MRWARWFLDQVLKLITLIVCITSRSSLNLVLNSTQLFFRSAQLFDWNRFFLLLWRMINRRFSFIFNVTSWRWLRSLWYLFGFTLFRRIFSWLSPWCWGLLLLLFWHNCFVVFKDSQSSIFWYYYWVLNCWMDDNPINEISFLIFNISFLISFFFLVYNYSWNCRVYWSFENLW